MCPVRTTVRLGGGRFGDRQTLPSRGQGSPPARELLGSGVEEVGGAGSLSPAPPCWALSLLLVGFLTLRSPPSSPCPESSGPDLSFDVNPWTGLAWSRAGDRVLDSLGTLAT